MKKNKKSNQEILSVLSREIHNASGYIGGELVARRKKSLEYYLGSPLGNEQEGRSQVVSNDVLDTVESLMPSLMRIFTSGDNVFNCEGMGPEDEEMARQCSDYLNYIFYKENDGFLALYTAFKDALIQKNGILKVYWDDAAKIEREEYSRLTDDEFSDLVSMDEIKTFFAELDYILETFSAEVTVLICDTKIRSVQKYQAGDTVERKVLGRGGTDFDPCFKWAENTEFDPSCMIYLTDMECTPPLDSHFIDYPIVWASTQKFRTKTGLPEAWEQMPEQGEVWKNYRDCRDDLCVLVEQD